MLASEKLRCSSRIAAALLDSLAATGNYAGHGCVRRVYENETVNPRTEGAWIPARIIDAAFRSLNTDRNLARRVGYALVSSERIGFMLYSGGVATIEKAYRRCEPMLPREERDGRFHTLDVSHGRARIAYHPGSSRHSHDTESLQSGWNPSFCGVREGMLEALPLSYGLLPARVRETECVGKGATHCTYEVHFEGRSVRGALIGLGVGTMASLAICGLLIPEVSIGVQGILGVLIAALFCSAGFSVDLARQLQAVAGARRGQLALLEQADRALAEKMDELAKLGARSDASGGESTERLRRLLEERQESLESRPEAARKKLDCDEEDEPAATPALKWIQLADVVANAADSVRATMLPSQRLLLDIEEGLPRLRCSPFQVEQVTEQLIKNAAQASFDDGDVRVALRLIGEGIELTVEDGGCGIPEEDLDQLFDPFAEEGAPEEAAGGLGLAICYRIVVEHGGEMSVSSDAQQGTRVTVMLPREDRSQAV